MQKLTALFIAGALSVMLTPLTSSAQHCTDVFLLSGTDAAEMRQGVNPGFFGCTADEENEDLSTNIFVPGSTHGWVGALAEVNPASGTIDLDGAVVDLEFALNDARGRWESQSVELAGVSTAIITVVGESGTFTVEYNSL